MSDLTPVVNALYQASSKLPEHLLEDENVIERLERAIAVLRGEQ